MTHSARRINAIGRRLGFRAYLEIGVSEGETFRQIEAQNKTGVDPHFRFDRASVEGFSTKLVETTSDLYFSTLPIDQKFDAVFIDGLHTFEQVVRDFSNAMIHTHDRSVIVLDDTIPSDVYSSLPDIRQTVKFRNAAGGTNADWHGDVYKAVFYINDFWPGLNFRTIISNGNPQTVVWRSNSTSHRPVFNNFEAISRLTFFELHAHLEALRGVDEEQAITDCLAELATYPRRGDP